MIDLGTTTSVTIRAPIEEVWKTITTPDLIKRWFFGVDTETDWQVGSPLVHRGEWQGKTYEDSGTTLRFEPPTLLVHSHRSPAASVPDRPEHDQEVTWSLSERDGETILTVAETNLPSQEAKAISEQSWEAALTKLKEQLEA